MSEKAIARPCEDKSLHAPHPYWLPKTGGDGINHAEGWAGYERGACPGVTEESRNAEATRAVIEKEAEAIRIKLHTNSNTAGLVAAPQTDEELDAAMKFVADKALHHSHETAHVTQVIFRPVPTGTVVGWRCDYCLAGDE